MINRIRLKNFRRYEDQTVEFGEGINLITGRNNAGKTTLFYALEYVFFGAVAHFKTPAAFLQPGERTMGVEVEFISKDGDTYILQRVHEKPPKAKTKIVGHFTLKKSEEVEGEVGEQYVVSSDFQDREESLALQLFDLLGISKRLFETSIHTRQGQCAAILSGSPQLDMILGVTAAVIAGDEMRALALGFEKETAGMAYIDEAIENSRQQIKELSIQNEEIELEEKNSTSSPKESEKLIKEAQKKEQVWVGLGDLAQEVDREKERLNEIAEQLKTIQQDDLKKAITAGKKKITTLKKKVEKAQAGVAEAGEERETLLQQLGDLEGRLGRAKQNEGKDSCETCGQEIDQAFAASQRKDWEKEYKEATKEQSKQDSLLSKLSEESEAIQKEIGELEDSIREMEQQISVGKELVKEEKAVEEKIGQVEAKLAKAADGSTPDRQTIEETLDELRTARIRLETERDHFQSQQDRFTREKKRFSEKTKELEKEISTRQQEKLALQEKADSAATFRKASKLYKELQVKIREKAAQNLGDRTLEIHQHLSGGSNEFSSISIDSQNYGVQIVPKDLKTEVPAWLYQGGGQKALLGISYKLSLAELAGNCPFLLLDEPTDGLDVYHRESLFESLASCPTAKQILIITHEAPEHGDYYYVEIER